MQQITRARRKCSRAKLLNYCLINRLPRRARAHSLSACLFSPSCVLLYSHGIGCARGGDNQLTLGSASFLLCCSDVVQIEENAAKRLLCECASEQAAKRNSKLRVSYKVTPGKTRIYFLWLPPFIFSIKGTAIISIFTGMSTNLTVKRAENTIFLEIKYCLRFHDAKLLFLKSENVYTTKQK